MKKEFSAGLIVYRQTEQGPKFLLLYHGGRYWNFPKGHIEYKRNVENQIVTTSISEEDMSQTEEWNARETSKEAAIRETFEETGISPDKLDVKKGFRAVEKFYFYRNKEKVFKVVIFYLAETTERDIKISSEHDGFGWFSHKDARYILSNYKDSQKLLKSVSDFVKQSLDSADTNNPQESLEKLLKLEKYRRQEQGFNKRTDSSGPLRDQNKQRKNYFNKNRKPNNNNRKPGGNNPAGKSAYYYNKKSGEGYDII